MAASLPPTVGSKGYLSLANGLALLARGDLFFCRILPSGSRLSRPLALVTPAFTTGARSEPRHACPLFVAVSMQVQEGEQFGTSRPSSGRARSLDRSVDPCGIVRTYTRLRYIAIKLVI